MPIPMERQSLGRMREMFARVAPRYDLITRLFSFGMDAGWKRLAVQAAQLPERPVVLDLACGTGDFSRLVRERHPGAVTVPCDLTHRMLELAREQGNAGGVCADAMRLPFRDAQFDGVFAGYGLRNFPDLGGALAEIQRVTKPGGLLVSLDFFLPEDLLFRRLYLGYLWVQGWWWGLLLHGRPRTYTYIPDSLRSFETMAGLAGRLRRAGFERVRMRPFVLGGIGLHWASK